MPGISGVINSNIRLSNPAEILRMFEKVHALRGVSFIQRTFRSDHCVIANMLTGLIKTTLDQPASDPTGNTFLFLEGEVYNTEDLLGYLSKPRDMPLCTILLALFLERGAEFVSLVNGEFNIVIYQKAERQLTILNDHLSSKPMYYMEQGDSLLFGSEMKSILAIAQGSPTIDATGLLQVFAYGYNLGGRTFIEGIKRLAPASRLDYHQGQLSLTRNPPMTFKVPKPLPRIGSLIEEWSAHLKRATIRRLQGKERIAIGLTGGLDSRAISCAIPRDFRPISARTRGVQDAREVIYAAEIARRLGFDHHRENPAAMAFSEMLPKIVWRTECPFEFKCCFSIANHAVLKGYADFMVGGALGDVSSGSRALRMFHHTFPPCDRRQFIDRAYRRDLIYSEASLRELFNEEFLRKSFPRLRDTFLASFDPIEGETPLQIYETWYLYEKQVRRTLTTPLVDSYLFEQIRPFVDREYLGFVLTLPSRLRFGQALYQAMIYQIGPEIRDIPYSNTNLKLRGTVLRNSLNSAMALGTERTTKLLRRIGLSPRHQYVRADVGDPALSTRQDPELRRIVEAFVHSSSFDPSIFNGPGILSMLDKHYRGVADYTNLLCTLATFVVGLPYFVYNRPSQCPPEAEPLSRDTL